MYVVVEAIIRCEVRTLHGVYLWTAGQRGDPENEKSPFHWKQNLNRRHPHYGRSNFTFTNWHPHEPDNMGGLESCVNIWPRQNFTWNDESCLTQMCFVCEEHFV